MQSAPASVVDEEIIDIIIPAGVSAGESINVQTVDGRIFSVIVPRGSYPGEHLIVAIDCSSSSGATVESIPQEKLPHSSNRKAIGATAAAAVIGTLLVGPITGVCVAGVALYATTRSDNVGDAARSAGGAVCSAYDTGAEMSSRYQIPQKIKAAGMATVTKMQEIDSEYKLTEKATVAGKEMAKQAKELDSKYAITATASSALAQGMALGTRELLKLASSATASNQTSTPAGRGASNQTSGSSSQNASMRL